jgi:hypothetical protein
MKKVVVVMALFFAVGVSNVSAQDAAKPKKQQFGWNKKYMDEIGVNADVQSKIETVKKESDTELKTVREDATLTPEQKKEQTKALMLKRQKGIFALLTPEQLVKSKEIMASITKANAAIEAGQ